MLQTDPILESTSTVASAASTTQPKEGTLGFLIKRKTIKLPSVTKRQEIKLLANLGFNESDATEELKKATDEVEKIKTIKALTEAGDVPIYLKRHVNFIVKEFNNLKKEITLLLGYKDVNRQQSKEMICSQTLPGINTDFLQALTADLKTNVNFLQTTLSVEQLLSESNSFYENMVITLFRIREILGDARTIVKNYAILLDNLTAYKLSDINLWYLQIATCVEDFLVEKYAVKECNKVNTGIECKINLKVYKSLKDLEVYTPISYNGYELAMNSGEYAVKDENSHWGKLKCTSNILDEDRDNLLDSDVCTYRDEKSICFKNIEGKDFNKIKKYCTFTEKQPESVILTDNGLLIQNKDAKIKEIDTDKRSFPLMNKEVPYLIKSDKILSVHDRDFETLYEPIYSQVTKQIVTTFLDEVQKNSLTTLQAIKNWDWEDTKEIILGVLTGLTCLIILILIVICKRDKLRNRLLVRTANNPEETQRRQQNYRLNRIFLRN